MACPFISYLGPLLFSWVWLEVYWFYIFPALDYIYLFYCFLKSINFLWFLLFPFTDFGLCSFSNSFMVEIRVWTNLLLIVTLFKQTVDLFFVFLLWKVSIIWKRWKNLCCGTHIAATWILSVLYPIPICLPLFVHEPILLFSNIHTLNL